MDDDMVNIVGRSGLEKTYAQFPDEMREAHSSALTLVAQIRSDPAYSDEPAHIFQAGRGHENQARDDRS